MHGASALFAKDAERASRRRMVQLRTGRSPDRLLPFLFFWVSRSDSFRTGAGSRRGSSPMQRIYVGNLSFQTTEQGLTELFAQHGSVNSVAIITDRITGRSRGFAFVEMNDDAEAKAAMEALNGKEFDGRPLRVAEAKERADRH
jgi:RNA recognition motif-containing protein